MHCVFSTIFHIKSYESNSDSDIGSTRNWFHNSQSNKTTCLQSFFKTAIVIFHANVGLITFQYFAIPNHEFLSKINE